jgi:hypothetical protein
VDIGRMKSLRLDNKIIIFEMAKNLEIQSSDYSKYESEKEDMPKELYDKAIHFITQRNEKR